MSDAFAAIRERRFERAIEFLQAVVSDRPNYHIAWLNIGKAQREWAVDQREEGNGEATRDACVSLLENSLSSFERAKGHIDRQYRAEACYHASKSYYRLWQHDKNSATLQKAIEEAKTARTTFPDIKYETWVEYLESAELGSR